MEDNRTGTESTSDRPVYSDWPREALLLRVEELEKELDEERDLSLRTRRKAKQLHEKLKRRDEALEEMQGALSTAQAAAELARSQAASMTNGAKKAAGRTASSADAKDGNKESRPRGQRQSKVRTSKLTSRDLAVRERAEIVAQLEGHLAQMLADLRESDREVQELEEKQEAKEVEWWNTPETSRSEDSSRLHWQALSMITQQVQEKRMFSDELTRKTRELEEQVVQQRALIDEFGQSGSGSRSEGELGHKHSVTKTRSSAAKDLEEHVNGNVVEFEDEALAAFLAAAGSAGDAIRSRPALRAAFEISPPQLAADAIEGLSAEHRAEVISLFAAWVAVAGAPPRTMHLTDISLQLADASELHSTLETCSAQLEEWDMTRCPANERTMRILFDCMTTQPLRQLNLGYNALGPSGVSALVAVSSAWSGTLETLSLEMNGLGDAGCTAVAQALLEGSLPGLRALELGWNELSPSCSKVLAELLSQRGTSASASSTAPGKVPALRKLGLGGNRLESEGATTLALAALAHPTQTLELDLSMNHVDAPPLLALAEWVESHASQTAVDICFILEWNAVEDIQAVRRLATVFAASNILGRDEKSGSPNGSSRSPLIKLANNEFSDLEPSDLFALSRGLVVC